MSTATLRKRQAYCLAVLTDPELHPRRRQLLEATLVDASARLGVRCSTCGRLLEAIGSIAQGVGPVCAHKAG